MNRMNSLEKKRMYAVPVRQISETNTVACNRALVKRLAYRLAVHLPSSVAVDDLVQAGMMGLLDAMTRYRDAGASFQTFAVKRIRGAMLDELRSLDRASRRLRDAGKRIERATCEVEQRLGRMAREAEIAAQAQMSLEEYRTVLRDLYSVQFVSCENPGEEEAGFISAACREACPGPEADLSDMQLREALIDAIEQLPEAEKRVLSLYYVDGLYMREIGAVLDVTVGRVCQRHSHAMRFIRSRLQAFRLEAAS